MTEYGKDLASACAAVMGPLRAGEKVLIVTGASREAVERLLVEAGATPEEIERVTVRAPGWR